MFHDDTGYAKIVPMTSRFRSLPSVDRLLSEESIKELAAVYPREFVIRVVRQRLESHQDFLRLSG